MEKISSGEDLKNKKRVKGKKFFLKVECQITNVEDMKSETIVF